MTRLDRLAHSMIHDCVDAIVAKTLTGTIVAWNAAAEQLFGYTEREALGHSIMMLVPQDKAIEESEVLARLARGERMQDFTTCRLHKNGNRISVMLTISPIHDGSGNVIGAAVMVRPASQEDAKQKELQALAYRDQLTGVSNRVQLLDRLTQAMRRDERSHNYGGILFVDLDNFKVVNDTAGHAAGDRVLVACAQRMQAVLRQCDTVARWGGDEFVVMIEDLGQDFGRSLEIMQKIANKLLQALRRPYDVNGAAFNCSPSIGASLFRGVSQPLDLVIHNADKAMYRAKLAGKNAIHIDAQQPPEMVSDVPTAAAVA
ncbi:MAG: diguanylate cyclase [Steroidobacteraceae bacterium]